MHAGYHFLKENKLYNVICVFFLFSYITPRQRAQRAVVCAPFRPALKIFAFFLLVRRMFSGLLADGLSSDFNLCSLKLASLPNVYIVNSRAYIVNSRAYLVKAKFIFLAKGMGAFWLEIYLTCYPQVGSKEA